MKQSAGWWAVLAASVITINLFIFSKSDFSSFFTHPWLAAGQLTGLLGIVLLSAAHIFAVRIRFVENLFGGLDKSYSAHHFVGGIGTMLVISHPFFFVIQALPNTALAMRYIVLDPSNIPYAAGIVALAMLVSLVILTIYVTLPYHIWRSLHQWMGITMIFSGIHAMLIQSDVSRFMPLRIWILGCSGLAILGALYMRFVYPYLKFRYAYEVLSIERIGDMFDLRLRAQDRKLRFLPGQFAFLSVPGIFEKGDGHPFSIVSHPSDEELRFGIKISGDHTLKLRDVKKGDMAYVQGPYGKLAEPYFIQKNRPVVCVAGGIGITPFLALLKQHVASRSENPFTIIYSVRSTAEAVYHDEIQSLALCNAHVCYRLHVTKSEGRVTAESVTHTAPEVSRSNILLCGPEQMMLGLRSQFMSQGVRQARIHYENFSFA